MVPTNTNTAPNRNYTSNPPVESPVDRSRLTPEMLELAKQLKGEIDSVVDNLPSTEDRVADARARRAANDRRYNPLGSKTQVANLSPRHRAIMRAKLRGLSNVEIAELAGVTPQAITIVVNSDIFQAELSRMEDQADNIAVTNAGDVKAKIKEMTGKSVDLLDEMLNDTRQKARLRADIAFDILDRGGHKPIEKKEINVAVDLTRATIAAYRRRKLALVSKPPAEAPIIEIEAAPTNPPVGPSDGPSQSPTTIPPPIPQEG